MAEKEYIEREATTEALKDNVTEMESDIYYGSNKGVPKDEIEDIVNEIPAADVVKVKHGKWIIKVDDYDCELMCCSICKSEFYDGDNDTVDHLHNYCPNCGAKMDGKGD